LSNPGHAGRTTGPAEVVRRALTSRFSEDEIQSATCRSSPATEDYGKSTRRLPTVPPVKTRSAVQAPWRRAGSAVRDFLMTCAIMTGLMAAAGAVALVIMILIQLPNL